MRKAKMIKVKKAVILAGGQGSRLRPITYEIPKPLIPVKRQAILSHFVKFLSQSGILEVAIIIAAKHERDFKRWRKENGKTLGAKVKFFVEREPKGTYGALKEIKNWVNQSPFVLANGDSLIEFNFQKLYEFHFANRPTLSLALLKVDNPEEYGMARLAAGKVKGITLKQKYPYEKMVMSGFYIAEPEFLTFFTNKKSMNVDKDVLPKLIKEEKFMAIPISESRVFDCGTLERWEKAIQEW